VCTCYWASKVQGNATHYLDEVDKLDDVDIDDDVERELEVDTLKAKNSAVMSNDGSLKSRRINTSYVHGVYS